MDQQYKERIETHRDQIQQIASQHGASNLRLVATNTAGLPEGTEGDIAVVAAFRPDMTLSEQKKLQQQLSEVLDCAVAVVSERRLEPEAREQVRKEALAL